MKRVFKWIGIVAAGLVTIIVAAAVVLYFVGGTRVNRVYSVQVAPLSVPTDSTSIARGRHLAQAVTLCLGCHGENLEGDVLVDEPIIATIYASNLTTGRGGVGAKYSDTDMVRAIRDGVNPDGRGLMIMHSDAYLNLGEDDLGAIIAYVRSVPPVDNEVPPTSPGWLGKIFVAMGMFDTGPLPLIAAERIDHAVPFVDAPPQDTTSDYGRYLTMVGLCSLCHGADLTGGPPMEEGAVPAPNIAVYGAPGVWTREQFVSTIRTGVTPAGRALDTLYMPWIKYAGMTDDELTAIWRYMVSLNGG